MDKKMCTAVSFAIMIHIGVFAWNFFGGGAEMINVFRVGLKPAESKPRNTPERPPEKITKIEAKEYDFAPDELEPPPRQLPPEIEIPEIEDLQEEKPPPEFVMPDTDKPLLVIERKKKPLPETPKKKISDKPSLAKGDSPVRKVVAEAVRDGRAKINIRPECIYKEELKYPQIARRRGYEGIVKVKIKVMPNGSVGAVEVVTSSEYELLDKAVLEAVKKYRFRPVVVNGIPIMVNAILLFEFKLIDQD